MDILPSEVKAKEDRQQEIMDNINSEMGKMQKRLSHKHQGEQELLNQIEGLEGKVEGLEAQLAEAHAALSEVNPNPNPKPNRNLGWQPFP